LGLLPEDEQYYPTASASEAMVTAYGRLISGVCWGDGADYSKFLALDKLIAVFDGLVTLRRGYCTRLKAN